jgi:hypothetical protein
MHGCVLFVGAAAGLTVVFAAAQGGERAEAVMAMCARNRGTASAAFDASRAWLCVSL